MPVHNKKSSAVKTGLGVLGALFGASEIAGLFQDDKNPKQRRLLFESLLAGSPERDLFFKLQEEERTSQLVDELQGTQRVAAKSQAQRAFQDLELEAVLSKNALEVASVAPKRSFSTLDPINIVAQLLR